MNYQHLSLKSSKAWLPVVALGIFGMALPAIVHAQTAQNSAPSIERRWRLVDMGGRPTPPVSSAAPPVTAEFSSGRLFGFGGCNQFTTSYQTTGTQLTVGGAFASTQKACPEPIMQQESDYLTALQGAQDYNVSQQELRINYKTAQGKGVLHFVLYPLEPSTYEIHW